jgi:hypothetical protein
MSNESSGKTPVELGWKEKTSQSRFPGKIYYTCNEKSQFEKPTVECKSSKNSKVIVTVQEPDGKPPAQYEVKKVDGEKVVEKVGGKRKRKLTRRKKLRKQKTRKY